MDAATAQEPLQRYSSMCLKCLLSRRHVESLYARVTHCCVPPGRPPALPPPPVLQQSAPVDSGWRQAAAHWAGACSAGRNRCLHRGRGVNSSGVLAASLEACLQCGVCGPFHAATQPLRMPCRDCKPNNTAVAKRHPCLPSTACPTQAPQPTCIVVPLATPVCQHKLRLISFFRHHKAG